MRVIAAIRQEQGRPREQIFESYPAALNWCGRQTKVTRPVCIADSTAFARHDLGEPPAWSIRPI